MKKVSFWLLAMGIFISNIYPVQAAIPKAGTNCAKSGSIQVFGLKKFTCTKTGKKLLWRITLITPSKVKSSPTPTASRTPSPSPSVEVTAGPLKIDSISELPERFKDIKYWAWKNTWAEIDSQVENTSDIEIHIGPNSKICHVENTQEAVRLLQKVYGDVKQPKKLHIIYADVDTDRTWLENKTLSLLPKDRIQYDNSGRMAAIETVNLLGEGVLWATDSCSLKDPINFSSQVLHGYTHTIQDLQYSEIPRNYGRWGEVPRWLIEGGASWSQVFYNDNKSLKKYQRGGDWGILSSYDAKFFKDYLLIPEYSNNLWAYTDKWPGMRSYDLGVFVCEMLIALKGPGSIIELNSDYLRTGSFEMSFKNLYGMTWAQAQPFISEAAYKQIQWLANS